MRPSMDTKSSGQKCMKKSELRRRGKGSRDRHKEHQETRVRRMRCRRGAAGNSARGTTTDITKNAREIGNSS